MIIYMAMTIVFSPVGVSPFELVNARIANVILTNIPIVALLSIFVLNGFSRFKWETPGQNHAAQYAVGPGQQPYYPQYYNAQPYYPQQQWPAPTYGQPPMQQAPPQGYVMPPPPVQQAPPSGNVQGPQPQPSGQQQTLAAQ
jgi:hypothetical protein